LVLRQPINLQGSKDSKMLKDPSSEQPHKCHGAPAYMKIGFADAAMMKQWCNSGFNDAIFKAAYHKT
jgi:hypothetical protein